MIVTSSILLDILIGFFTIIVFIISYVKWKYTYWKRLGLEGPEPTFPFGNIKDAVNLKETTGQLAAKIYRQVKAKGLKHTGYYFFHLPIYMPVDPELIKQIMQVDFDHFTDHGVYFNERDDPLTAHLFAMEGTKWKNVRAKLTPTFTSGKMKMMFPLVVKSAEQLKVVLDSKREGVEMKDILARVTTDIIGTCAFGLDCNSLSDPNNEFRKYGKRMFQLTGKELMANYGSFLFPNFMRFFGVKIIPECVSDFFTGVVKETVNFRESNNVQRKDFMQLLLQLKNDSADSKMTMEELAAHAFIFYVAGFETSSSTMSLCLFELCVNEEIQEKVRQEINDVIAKHKGEFNYEAMMELTLMDMVIHETLRKYPSLAALTRTCTKDYRIPETDIVLPKGTRVFIPVEALHYDPEYYKKPEVFDPSRFSEENKRNIRHFTYLPFGDGPRNCIGLRFGLMQIKIVLTHLLKDYRFKLNSQTKLPLKMDPKNFVNTVIGGIWVNIEKVAT